MIVSPSDLKKMIDAALAKGHSVDLDLETGKLLIHAKEFQPIIRQATEFDIIDMKRKTKK